MIVTSSKAWSKISDETLCESSSNKGDVHDNTEKENTSESFLKEEMFMT